MSPVKGKYDDLYLSHSILNYLAAEIAGRYAFFSSAERMKVESIGMEALKAAATLMGKVDQWTEELHQLQPIFNSQWTKPETFQAEEVLGLLQAVQFDLDSLSSSLIQLLNDTEHRSLRDNRALAAAGLARSVFARSHYMQGYIRFGTLMKRPEMVEHFRTGLDLLKPDLAEVERFVELIEKDEEFDDRELFYRAVSLPGILRSRIHDISLMTAQFLGGLSFERCGFNEKDTAAWTAASVDIANAGYWRAFFFQPEEVVSWLNAGMSEAALAFEWRRHGFAPEESARWDERGIAPLRAALWRDNGTNPNEAAEWMARGILTPPQKPKTEAA